MSDDRVKKVYITVSIGFADPAKQHVTVEVDSDADEEEIEEVVRETVLESILDYGWSLERPSRWRGAP